MRNSLRSTLPPITLLAILAVSGCNKEVEDGSASVDFVLGNDKSCSDVFVEDIRVSLSNGGNLPDYSETAACENGPVAIEGIEPKNYDILVEGLDADGITIMDNLGESSEQRLEIFEGAEAQPTIDLTSSPAVVKVAWILGVSGTGNCESVGIQTFRVRTFEQGGGNLLLEHEFDCEDAEPDAAGFRVVPDEDRVLNGTLVGEVGVVPLDGSGDQIGDQVTFVFEPVGPGYPIELTIECLVNGCTSLE